MVKSRLAAAAASIPRPARRRHHASVIAEEITIKSHTVFGVYLNHDAVKRGVVRANGRLMLTGS